MKKIKIAQEGVPPSEAPMEESKPLAVGDIVEVMKQGKDWMDAGTITEVVYVVDLYRGGKKILRESDLRLFSGKM